MNERKVITLSQWRRRCVAVCPEDRILRLEFISAGDIRIRQYGDASKHIVDENGWLAVCGDGTEHVLGHWYAASGVCDVWHSDDDSYDEYDNANSPHLSVLQKALLQRQRDKRFDFVLYGVLLATLLLLLQLIGFVPKVNWLYVLLMSIIMCGLFQLISTRRAE